MHKFLSISLALALGFLVTIAPHHVSKGLSAPSDGGIERTAQLTSVTLSDSNAVEKDGIRMEISGPYPALPIPKKGLGRISLGLAVEITNHTSTTIRAGWDNLTPQLIGPDGQALQLQRLRSERSGTPTICLLLEPQRPGPRRTVGFSPGELSWHNHKLQLKIAAGPGDVRYFDDLKPGTYQLRFIYYTPGGTTSCYDPDIRQVRTIEGLGAGRATTPFIPLRLVQPVAIDSNTVEVDGIRFETVVPKRVVLVPPYSSDATTPVPVGIRITNKTSTPRFFSYLDILVPSLIGPDGKPLNLESGRAGSAGSKCPRVEPGKSVTFFWDAKLSWQNNELQLEGSDSFNSFSQFKALKPGTYQIGMNYRPNLRSSCGLELQTYSFMPLRGLPINSGADSRVEIRLVQR